VTAPERASQEEKHSSIERVIELAFEQIRQLIREATGQAAEQLAGERLARNIAAFYKTLVENGVPQDIAARLTEKYLETYAEAVNPAKIANTFTGQGRAPSPEALPAAAQAYTILLKAKTGTQQKEG
jgi:hypothetical protein